MSGCVAFAKYNGPTMVEAELMPQCWEQVTKKERNPHRYNVHYS